MIGGAAAAVLNAANASRGHPTISDGAVDLFAAVLIGGFILLGLAAAIGGLIHWLFEERKP